MAKNNRWWINGLEITDGHVRDVSDRAGWERSASVPDTTRTTIANRPGELWTPSTVGPTGVTLNFWLMGDTEQQCLARWEELLRACYSAHHLADLRRVTPGGAARVAQGELAGAITPTWVGRQGMKGSLTFSIPSGAWLGEHWLSYTSNSGAGNSRTVQLPGLSVSTTEINHVEVEIFGPITNPKITDTTPGGMGFSTTYWGTIPDNRSLTLATQGWGVTGHNGLTPDTEAVVPTGRAFMAFAPTAPGLYHQLTLSAAGGTGANTKVAVRARPAFS